MSTCLQVDRNERKNTIGSANFSSNGLSIPYRESLMEVRESDLRALNAYIDLIKRTCRTCDSIDRSELLERKTRYIVGVDTSEYEDGVAKLDLLSRNGELPALSGINWGMSTRSHVNPDDGYIPIRTEAIKNHPEIFSPRPIFDEGATTRGTLDEVVELIWDDGAFMQVKFEGTQPITDPNGDIVNYPKNLSSFPNKSIMGRYLRQRIGVPSGVAVTTEDLERYGSHTIRISKISEGVFSADFSPETND